MRKVFVDVTASFSKDGDLLPVSFTWENGCKYEIDKILDMKKAASMKVGGHGIRYLCRVRNKEMALFLEEGKWFVEAK